MRTTRAKITSAEARACVALARAARKVQSIQSKRNFLEHKGGEVESTRSDIASLVAQTTEESSASQTENSLKFVPFPVVALPEPIRSFTTQAANAVDCDQSYIILPLL